MASYWDKKLGFGVSEEHTKEHALHDHPDFAWTTQTFTRNLEHDHRYYHAAKKSWEPKFKSGEEVPRSLKDAMRIDAENNFAYEDSWLYLIHSELGQVKDYKTFRLLEPGEQLTG